MMSTGELLNIEPQELQFPCKLLFFLFCDLYFASHTFYVSDLSVFIFEKKQKKSWIEEADLVLSTVIK